MPTERKAHHGGSDAMSNSSTDPAAAKAELDMLDEWGEEYVRALRVLASRNGVAAAELHSRLTRRIDETRATSECLTLAELDAWTNEELPAVRRAHVATCTVCAGVLQAMTVADPNLERAFVEHAVEGHAQGPAPSPGPPASPRFGASFAFGVTTGIVGSLMWRLVSKAR